MDIKDILVQGLKDGVGQFFDSVADQIQEQSKASLNMYYETLKEIEALLEKIGGHGKFDKNFKRADDICGFAYFTALIVSGQDIEGAEFQNALEGLEDNSLKDYFCDLYYRWEQTKVFVESGAFKSLVLEIEGLIPFLGSLFMTSLTEECDAYFESILTLIMLDDSKGLFATRKMKKKISPYSEKMYSVCTTYSFIIQIKLESYD